MELFPPYNENGDEGITSPQVEVHFEESQLVLHWLNSRIRSFPGHEQFDHVEYYDAEGKLSGVNDPELLKTLRQHNFPTVTLPYVDKMTFEWLVNGLADDIDGDLEGLEP